MNEIKKTSKLCFDPKMARTLLKRGFKVIDIKPNRANPIASIFVFENTDEFQIAFAEVMEEMKKKKELESEKEEINPCD